MGQTILDYVQHQIALAQARLQSYTIDGEGRHYPERHIFSKIKDHINNFIEGKSDQRWIIVPGLRGVGKTTVLAQAYYHFLNKHNWLTSTRMIYVSLDEVTNILGSTLKDVIDAYEQILGVSFEKQDRPIILLIDEVQYDPKWAAVLKSLYDRSKQIFIISTGSSAVSLQTNTDVIRRAIFEKLYPMSFNEYQMIKHAIHPIPGLKHKIMDVLYGSTSAEEAYNALGHLKPEMLQYWSQVDRLEIQEYLTIGTLPFALRSNKQAQIYESISLLLDRIILEDIQALGRFDMSTLGLIKRLLFIMADADVLSMNKITQLLPLDRKTILNIFDVLEKAELLIKVPAHGSSTKSTRKPAKYLFMSPAIRLALLNITGQKSTFQIRQGMLWEDIAALHFDREFITPKTGSLSYDSAKAGADFILKIANQKQLAIEVGAGDKSFRQTVNTMKKISCDYGVVFCKEKKPILNKDENILKIPLDYLLTM